jgi:hypothetical protein
MTDFNRPYQHRNCDGSWGPLIINNKQVYYEGYPNKPAPSTVQANQAYDSYYENKQNNSKFKEIEKIPPILSETKLDNPKIICKTTEDCNGTTYYERGYYETTENGGLKWIDCGSGYNVSVKS